MGKFSSIEFEVARRGNGDLRQPALFDNDVITSLGQNNTYRNQARRCD